MALRKSLAQLTRKVRQGLDEAQTSGFWSVQNVTDSINAAKDRCWTEVRKVSDAEFFVVTRSSTDATSDILGESYAPSSFAIATGTRDYILPPDYVEMREIESITDGQEHIRFSKRGLSDPQFRTALAWTTPQQPGGFLYAIFGERTMRIAPMSDLALDLRLTYVAVPPDLVNTADLLEMPFPLHNAVIEYAVADCLMGDRAPEAAAWEARGNSTIARFLGTADTGSTDPQFVQGYLEGE